MNYFLPKQTLGLVNKLCVVTKYTKEDLLYFAYVTMQSCRKQYVGEKVDFHKYLNRSICNKIRNAKRKKNIAIVKIKDDIQDYGYEQPNNVDVCDFRNFVQKRCSKKANEFLNFYLDQPRQIRLYSHKYIKANRKLGTNIIFDYMGLCRASRKKIITELRNAKREYDSY